VSSAKQTYSDHTTVLVTNASQPAVYFDKSTNNLFGHGLNEEEWSQGRFSTTYSELHENPINEIPTSK
jgi:hypothetical protein